MAQLTNQYQRLGPASLLTLLGTLACLFSFSLSPVSLFAQQSTRGQEQIRAMTDASTPEEIVQSLRDSGLTREQIREQLLRAGYDPTLVDPYFDMMEGVGDAPTQGGGEVATALSSLGILLRNVESSPEGGFGLAAPLSALDSLEVLTALLDSLEVETLSVFGKSFFERTTSFQFRQLENGAVGSDYRLGPGDEVVLLITGDVEATYRLDVNRSGMILIPDIGQVSVSGLTMADLENRLYDRLSEVYSGISRGGDATTHFDLSLGALRTIAVYVSGEVEKPNRYPLSSVATLLEALHAAGGPTNIGSLRKVRVERGQANLGEFDLYSYFVDGTSSGDIRLENGDLIFVPPVENQVILVGEVLREAIFEMLKGETAADLLKFAGGLSPDATRVGTVDRRLPLEERQTGLERILLDFPTNTNVEAEGAHSFEMFPGDSVTIHRVGAPYPELCEENDLGPDSLESDVLVCKEDSYLPPNFVRNWAEVAGAVWSPGVYQLKPEQTLSDLLETAGGVRPDRFPSIIHISRINQDTGQRSLIRTQLGSASEVTLEEFDRVTLFGQDSLLVPDSVSIFGYILEPGRYPFQSEMTAEDLILQAGGFQRGAIPWEAEVVEPSFNGSSDGFLSYSSTVSLSADLPYPDSSVAWPEASSLPAITAGDTPLGPGYEVYIRKLPNYETVRHVNITGEVMRPGTYVLQRNNERLTSIINRAGGLTEDAYPEGGRVTREGTPVGTDFVSAINGNQEEDLVLADLDEILIPVYDPTILVEGAVAFQSRMRYREGMDLSEVIENAGGYIYDADAGRVSVEYMNGQRSTVKKTLWLFKSSPPIEPGSRISVPLKSQAPGSGFDWNSALSGTLATLSAFATIYVVFVSGGGG